ncbi:hypothetical protein [Nonomuraea endophytica]|uniref:Uncharacterized protein n=1 Tax=Nonomuraea endophytica TaxID=714136 RepID=A0A7W8AFG8_9ACTN|nr:hypothetical protein [Nonomuraea endophytica]MBB5085200.1 hypothetical protein [Nonomuraea endophytica]
MSKLPFPWGSAEPAVSERWHAWPVSRVFPAALTGASPSGARVTYLLAGVAPEAPCRVALQAAAAAMLPRCLTTLRATYSDSTQTFVATVGVAVLDGAPSWLPVRAIPAGGRPPSVRPVAFPGGAAERFGDAQYVTGAVAASGGPYVVFTAAGYADGRPYQPEGGSEPRLGAAAVQLAEALHKALTR